MRSATETARLIRNREVSAEQTVRERLERLDETNASINAVITRVDAEALTRARELDARAERGDWAGPLHGVPFTVKDMFATRGVKTTYGMPHLIRHVPDHDADLVGAFLDAGAVLLGKTNLPFGSYDWQSVHPIYGRCRNPWNRERTVGGSSGGSAASLAAGYADLEIGSDAAGSIRVPAHYCGVAGIRPSEGTLSDRGHGDMPTARQSLDHFSVVGPMARTVEDLELAWSVFRGEDAESNASAKSAVDVAQLRFAWSSKQADIPTTRSVSRVMTGLRQSLVDAGAEVVDDEPDVDVWEAVRLWGRINGYELRQAFPRTATFPGIGRLSEWYWFRHRLGTGKFVESSRAGFRDDEQTYLEHLAEREHVIEQAEAFFESYDAWVLPGMPFVAFEHRPSGVTIPSDDYAESYADSHAAYHCPLSAMDCPVVSLPIGRAQDGLPVGIQIACGRGDDRRLLRMARAVESLRGSFSYPD